MLFFSTFLPTSWGWLPGTGSPSTVEGFVVNSSNRMDVLSFYLTVYSASEGYSQNIGWTGNMTTGVAGTTSTAFKEDVRRRVNFYRALAGLPADIIFDDTKNAKCQEAALMMAANNQLSHSPPSWWTFYSADGAEAASKSNLGRTSYGASAIDGYIEDFGVGNSSVRHRRWILYSRAKEMGTGDVPTTSQKSSANALWILTDHKPTAVPQFVAWPNAGFIPQSLVPARWSLSYPAANFGAATVTMTRNGVTVPISIVSRADANVGDNTIVWEPSNLPVPSRADEVYSITVSNISGTGVPTSYSYTVTTFHPGVLGTSVVVSGPSSASTSGQAFTFNSIAEADAYQLRVGQSTTQAWLEGAESTATILDNTASDYTLTQSTVKRSGDKAFHLAFPTLAISEQGFEIDREIIPSASSQLIFCDLFRFATTTSRLSAEVSEDNGSSWVEVWSRNGNGNMSWTGWDTSFNVRSISLSDYAGKILRIRFVYRFKDSASPGSTTNSGVFIDDVSVTNATQLTAATVTTLPKDESSFTLNSTTAGAPLTPGAEYFVRIRPNVGTKWFGDGPLKVVTVSQSPYDTWHQSQFTPEDVVTGRTEPNADFDGDGISNFLEYAFQTNPKIAQGTVLSPQPTLLGLQILFPCDNARTDLIYTVEASSTLAANSWTAIAESVGGATFLPIEARSTVSDSGTGVRTVAVTDTDAPPHAQARFLRVKVAPR